MRGLELAEFSCHRLSKSSVGQSRWPFLGKRTRHSQAASAAASCIPARTTWGFPPQSPRSSPARSPHSAGSSCTKTPSPAEPPPATTSSANKSPPAPLAPETYLPSRCAFSAAASLDLRPARCTAPRSESPLRRALGCFRRRDNISRWAEASLPRSAPLDRLPPAKNCGFLHALSEQTTIPLPRSTHAL